MVNRKEDDKNKVQVPLKVKYSEDFKRIYATGAVGGFHRYDLRIAFFTDYLVYGENLSDKPSAVRERKVEVILSPLAAVELKKWLDMQIQNIEKMESVKSKSPTVV
ncbi:DUF3467 domain-containing protein [Candidatus Bathyarchaeota archaeon]|nr:MAG: DUF3467 domain-containing protein [Candidatus Bathyarchaeota archaeon]